MKSKEEDYKEIEPKGKWGPLQGVYVIDFNARLNNKTNDIVNTKGPKFVWIPCEVSGAYGHELIINPILNIKER